MGERGMLTDKIQAVAVKHLGRKITVRELRLMPYIHYCLTNEQRADPARINDEERALLIQWRKDGWLVNSTSPPLEATKKFWAAMNEVIWAAYVNYH